MNSICGFILFLFGFVLMSGCNSSSGHNGQQATHTGAVTGRVTDGSKGIADIIIHVCNYKKNNLDTLECIDAGTARTDADGYYTAADIPGGNYYVLFDAGTIAGRSGRAERNPTSLSMI
jgi:hypothetical protein